MNTPTLFRVSALGSILFLSACGWVDSTGKQPGGSQALSSATLAIVEDGDSFAVSEKTQRTIVMAGPDSFVTDWQWELLDDEGNIESCVNFNGFRADIASNSVGDACGDDDSCTFNLEESFSDGVTRFNVTVPDLQRPAALTYKLSANNADGAYIERTQTMCAVAINEAPTAVQDDYVVIEPQALMIFSADSNLLRNDSDDNDVRNEPLRVDPTPAVAPQYASEFQLYSDGSFLYMPSEQTPLSVNNSISDSFVYKVTDGTHISTATVNIRLMEANDAPTLISTLPQINIDLANDFQPFELLDINNYFFDPENDNLSFTVNEDSLPESGNLVITSNGILQGTATESDVGEYLVQVSVSDSVNTVNTEFELIIESERFDNRFPGVTDIANKTVSGNFRYDISVFFNDVDGDELTFTARSLPPGTRLSANGVITGTSSSANRGSWIIVITADDGYGGTVDDGFRLTIR